MIVHKHKGTDKNTRTSSRWQKTFYTNYQKEKLTRQLIAQRFHEEVRYSENNKTRLSNKLQVYR